MHSKKKSIVAFQQFGFVFYGGYKFTLTSIISENFALVKFHAKRKLSITFDSIWENCVYLNCIDYAFIKYAMQRILMVESRCAVCAHRAGESLATEGKHHKQLEHNGTIYFVLSPSILLTLLIKETKCRWMH